MKKILIIFLLLSAVALAGLTYNAEYYRKNIQSALGGSTTADPIYLALNEIETSLEGTSGIDAVYLTPGSVPSTAAEGQLYYDATGDVLKYRNASEWVTLAQSGSATLDEAYDAGNGITVDGSAVTLTVTNTSNNSALDVVQNDTTNNPITMNLTNTGSGDTLQFTSTGGKDVDGTSSSWSVTHLGVGSFLGLVVGASDLVLENSEKIENGTNDVLLFNTGDEDLTIDFTTGANKLTLGANSTGATEIAFGDFVTLSGMTAITGQAADLTIGITADAGGEDLIISQAGAVDASVQVVSAGTGADAIDIEASAGGISIASTGGDTLIDATDKSIKLDCGEAGASDGIVLVTTGAASGIDITSLEDIDITTTGAAGEDISITNTGGSVNITATEAAADAIVINASTAVGGIDITSNADIDITTTGAATEDISITNTGGSIIVTATENDAGAIQLVTNGGTSEELNLTNTQGTGETAIDLNATAGGVNIDAAAAKDVDIAGGQVKLVSKDNAAGAISMTANIGTSETIVLTNTQGTAETAFNIDATAGGIDIDFATGKNMDILGGQFLVTSNENVASAIALTTNTGSSETIVVTNTQGTAAGSITLTSTVGGVTVSAGADDAVTLNPGTGGVNFSGDLIKNFTYVITADTDNEALNANMSGTVYTNAGAGGAQTFTLPAAAAGLTYTFIVAAVQELRVDPEAGDTININGTAASAAEYWTANAVGECITLVAIDTVQWIATSYTGTWTQESP